MPALAGFFICRLAKRDNLAKIPPSHVYPSHHYSSAHSRFYCPWPRAQRPSASLGTAHVWDLAKRKQVAKWTTGLFTDWGIIMGRYYTGGIFDMRFSDESNELLVCGMGSTRDPAAGNGKQLWQRFDWRSSPAKKLDETHSGEHGAGLMETLDQHPSGEHFVMAGRLFKGNWNVAFFDTATGKLLYYLDCGMRCTKARFNAGTVSQGNDKKKIKQFGRLKVFNLS